MREHPPEGIVRDCVMSDKYQIVARATLYASGQIQISKPAEVRFKSLGDLTNVNEVRFQTYSNAPPATHVAVIDPITYKRVFFGRLSQACHPKGEKTIVFFPGSLTIEILLNTER